MSTDNTSLTCKVQVADDVHAVALVGSLCDDGIDIARTIFCDLLQNDAKNIAADMRGVEYVSSSGIGMLVSVLKRCHQSSVNFSICGLTEDIHELFTLTRLDQVFTIAPDIESWKRSL